MWLLEFYRCLQILRISHFVDFHRWDRDDVVISPHVSGVTRGADAPAVFLGNYKRYQDGKDLEFVVDWDKGY